MLFLSSLVFSILCFGIGYKNKPWNNTAFRYLGHYRTKFGKIVYQILIPTSFNHHLIIQRRTRFFDFLLDIGLLKTKIFAHPLIDEIVYIYTDTSEIHNGLRQSHQFQNSLIELLKLGAFKIERSAKGLEVYFKNRLNKETEQRCVNAAESLSLSLPTGGHQVPRSDIESYLRWEEGLIWALWGYLMFSILAFVIKMIVPYGMVHEEPFFLFCLGLLIGFFAILIFCNVVLFRERTILGIWKIKRFLFYSGILVLLSAGPTLAGVNTLFASGQAQTAQYEVKRTMGRRFRGKSLTVHFPNGDRRKLLMRMTSPIGLQNTVGEITIVRGRGHLGFMWYEIP